MILRALAETGERFASFDPYVPAVNSRGDVAFQATLVGGATDVVVEDRSAIVGAGHAEGVQAVTSHADLNERGELSFYGTDASGRDAVFLVRDGVVHAYASGFHDIGPAGPTMDEAGGVAFRGERIADVPGVHVVLDGKVRTIAERGDTFEDFFGLPLIGEGAVVFRADRRGGVQGIFRATLDGGPVEPIVETGDSLVGIAPFPSWAAGGGIAFASTTADGVDGVFVVRDGVPDLQAGGDAFETHRGALGCGKTVIRIATPRGGGLGLFAGPDPAADRIVMVGDPLLGSTVQDLAANPVSVNAAGRLAVRIGLADGREAIVCADLP